MGGEFFSEIFRLFVIVDAPQDRACVGVCELIEELSNQFLLCQSVFIIGRLIIEQELFGATIDDDLRALMQTVRLHRIFKFPFCAGTVEVTIFLLILRVRKWGAHTRPEDHDNDIALGGRRQAFINGGLWSFGGQHGHSCGGLVPGHDFQIDFVFELRLVLKLSNHFPGDLALFGHVRR